MKSSIIFFHFIFLKIANVNATVRNLMSITIQLPVFCCRSENSTVVVVCSCSFHFARHLRGASGALLCLCCQDAEMSRTNQTCHLVIKSPNSSVSPVYSLEDGERQTFHFLLLTTVISGWRLFLKPGTERKICQIQQKETKQKTIPRTAAANQWWAMRRFSEPVERRGGGREI